MIINSIYSIIKNFRHEFHSQFQFLIIKHDFPRFSHDFPMIFHQPSPQPIGADLPKKRRGEDQPDGAPGGTSLRRWNVVPFFGSLKMGGTNLVHGSTS